MRPRRLRAGPRPRRGSALLIVILLTVALSALALSGVLLASHASALTRSRERETELRYGSEAALQLARSRLDRDSTVFPDSGYVTLFQDSVLTGADSLPMSPVRVSAYLGPTGATSGQFGRFGSIVAVATDAQGSRVVRRLELAQETFAKFAYWSNRERDPSGGVIYFGGGDVLMGPVWSNDNLSISSTRATFMDEVGTAGTISGRNNGTFRHRPPYQERQPRIPLPATSALSRLQGYAAGADLAFTAQTAAGASSVLTRIEFVAIDLNGDGDSTDVDEGFLRIYDASPGQERWLRADYPTSTSASNNGTWTNCGDWHYVSAASSEMRFFPGAAHRTAAFRVQLEGSGHGITATDARAESLAVLDTIMRHPRARFPGHPIPRCFLGGDPRLSDVERGTASGGSDTTFYATGPRGSWRPWPGAVDPRLTGYARRPDAAYLFPLHRSQNPNSKGVIHVTGTVGVSGVVRGRLTLHATGTIVILDDLRYASDPGSNNCNDMLGMIAGANVTVADNAVLTPPDIALGSGTVYRNVDDTKDLHLHAVVMALNTSFGVEHFNTGPTSANDCETSPAGRGCLYLTGGIIQERRGAVGQLSSSGLTGYLKRYSYDRCVLQIPPPYFPTTGRFKESQHLEVDPLHFDIAAYFNALTPP